MRKTISFQTDIDTYEMLLLKRKHLGETSVSAIIRLALDNFFSTNKASKGKPKQSNKETSND